MRYRGGYYTFHTDLIKRGLHGHTATLENPVPPELIGAVNCLQKTAWRVNPFVLRVMSEAWERGLQLPGLPRADDRPLPPEIPAEQWDAMTKEERAKAKHARSLVHDENNRLGGKREEFLRKLGIAQDLAAYEAFWFPHAIDFRGRAYPLPQDLHPQADDVGRGLLMFSRGKPMGDTGRGWQYIALANAAGQDKLPFADRIAWVNANAQLIQDSVYDPLDGERFWCSPEIDSPWQFLAIAGEMVNGGGSVPICVDATCSGIQHLSAMGLDPIGGRAVNLQNTGARQDLYSEVSRAVAEAISAAALAGDPLAQEWAGKVTRAVVKRAVMTTPYGVTSRGITSQLLADGHLDWAPKSVHQQELAVYMTRQIIAAMAGTARSAREIMTYFQDCARVLADADRPLEWITPSGLRCRQAYTNVESGRVRTLMGDFRTTREAPGLDAKKQTQSAAPNVVHSFDGAHLAATVIECYRAGIYDLALVHDSYGTHACDVEQMQAILRRTFVEIYQEDRLEKFDTYLRYHNPGVDLPARPARGELDIQGVLGSPYFFS